MARTEPKKSRQRKWVRYERQHSNSLWHTDWFELGGKNVIAFVDDASRLATAVLAFHSATAANAVRALSVGINQYGKPKQIMSDHGVQFTTIQRSGSAKPELNVFQHHLQDLDIQHIKARVKHPQSNGKLERFVETIRTLRPHFRDLKQTVEYYNFRRPHMSLETNKLRTPYQAFLDKKEGQSEEKLISG